jgi:hypothetical protein
MREHHDERQDEPFPQDLAHAIAGLELCSHDHVVSYALHRFSDSFRFLGEDGRGKGLGQEEERGELNEDGEDGG